MGIRAGQVPRQRGQALGQLMFKAGGVGQDHFGDSGDRGSGLDHGGAPMTRHQHVNLRLSEMFRDFRGSGDRVQARRP